MKTLDERRKELVEKLTEFRNSAPDDQPTKSGVLLSNDIEHYVATHNLIAENFDRSKLKPAAYELTVGDEFYLDGEKGEFRDDALHIPSFKVAIIKTREIANIPNFLIARWNLRVAWAYKGLLWVGAAQVDPGYTGHLFCPIYNLSNEEVKIQRGEDLAVIDFVKTTPFSDEISKTYAPPHERPRHLLEDYKPELKSALFAKATEKISDIEGQIEDIRNKTNNFGDDIKSFQNSFLTFVTITFATLAIIISAGTIFTKFNINEIFSPEVVAFFWFFFASLASLCGFYAYSAVSRQNLSAKLSNMGDRKSHFLG